MAQEKQTISKLKEVKFSALSLHEKVAIKRGGRPLPDVQISQPGLFKKRITITNEEIEVAIEAYPMINKEILKTELNVFYSRSDMHKYCKLIDLLKLITENNLADVLGEMTKLIKILLTIPMTTSEPERCFSTLNRIKTFLRSTMNQERLNALAVISIEKIFVNSTSDINEKVIDLFAQIKTRRMDFKFK